MLRLQLKTSGGASSMLEKFSSQKIGSYIFCNCTHQVDAWLNQEGQEKTQKKWEKSNSSRDGKM